MNNKITETEIKLAWGDWQEDQKTYPNPVNPQAFIYGWRFGWCRKNQELSDLQAKYEKLKEDRDQILQTVANSEDLWANVRWENAPKSKYQQLKEAFLKMFAMHYDYSSDKDYCLGGESEEFIRNKWMEEAGLTE